MHCVLALLLLLVAVFAQAQDAAGLLEKSRKHVNAQQSVAYAYTAYWPNMMNEVDTIRGKSRFVVGKQQTFPFDFVSQERAWDFVYINGKLTQITHNEQKVELYPEDEKLVREEIMGATSVKWSPLVLLSEKTWQYVRDTTIVHSLAGYRMVDLDTMINGKHVYVYRWLYIGKQSLLPEWYVQESFSNGKSGQRIEFQFSDYTLSKKAQPLAYAPLAGYRSTIYGAEPGPEVLQAGKEAPVFQVTDLQGKPIDLKALRGKKVLLNFSMVNCGYCKLALDHMNQEGFSLPKDVVGVYIDPVDKKDLLMRYAAKAHIPFPVVADARALGTMYGVSGYPTFFLIDEKGVIQETVVGYRKEFLDGLAKTE
jgi:peroxiredoxin